MNELTEKKLDSRRIYEGRILNLRVDRVLLPNDREGMREVVEHAPAVAILATNESGEVLLIEQFRYAAGERLLELPAGIVETGEDPQQTAVRELQEETGWKPGSIRKIATFFTSPGFSDELLLLYYADHLQESKLPQDDDEFIVPRFCSREEIANLITDGRIRDAKTLAALCWWLSRRGETG